MSLTRIRVSQHHVAISDEHFCTNIQDRTCFLFILMNWKIGQRISKIRLTILTFVNSEPKCTNVTLNTYSALFEKFNLLRIRNANAIPQFANFAYTFANCGAEIHEYLTLENNMGTFIKFANFSIYELKNTHLPTTDSFQISKSFQGHSPVLRAISRQKQIEFSPAIFACLKW